MQSQAATTEPDEDHRSPDRTQESVRRVVQSLGLPSEAPRLRSARPPPRADFGDERAQSDDFYADPPSLDEQLRRGRPARAKGDLGMRNP